MRWLWFLICAVLGLALLACGLLVPMHLRAVDAGVLERAGRSGPVVARTRAGRWRANRNWARPECSCRRRGWREFPGWDRLGETITNLARQNPAALAWGDDARVKNLFAGNAQPPDGDTQPFTDFIVRRGKPRRGAGASERFAGSGGPGIVAQPFADQNTVLFPPSSSASGQAFDAAVCIGGLLLDGNHLTAGLARGISTIWRAGQSRRRFRTAGASADGFHVAGRAVQLGPAHGVCRANSGRRNAASAGRAGPQRRTTIARPVCRGATFGQTGGGGRLSRASSATPACRTSARVCVMARAAWANWCSATSAFTDPDWERRVTAYRSVRRFF